MIPRVVHWRDPLLVMRGSVARILGMLVQLVVIARWCGPEQLGVYSFALAMTMPIILVATWHLRQVLAMDAHGRFAWAAYSRLRTASLTVGGVLLGVVCWCWPTAQLHVVLLGLVYVAKVAEVHPELGHGLLQRHKDFGRVGTANAIRAVGATFALCFPLVMGAGLEVAVLVQAVVLVLVQVVVDRRYVAALIAGWKGESTSSIALLGQVWALGFAAGIGSLLVGIPRLMLVSYGMEAEAGVLLILLNLFAPATLLIAAFAQSSGSHLADAVFSRSAHDWWARMRRCVVVAYVSTLMNAVAAWLVTLALPWLLGHPFEVSLGLIVALAVSGALQAHLAFLGTGLESLGAHVIKLPNLVLQMAVLVASGSFLIPAHGLWGVVGSLAVSTLVVLFTTALSLNARTKRHFGASS